MTTTLIPQLEEIAAQHRQGDGFTPQLIGFRARVFAELLPPGEVLDLGCADGLLTARLCQRHRRVVGVDASEIRLDRAASATADRRNVELRRALFDDFVPNAGEQFDAAVLSCVLEHLPHPAELLQRVSAFLKPGGKLVAIVPHAGSLHRRAGVQMGMLSDITDSGSADDALGHERVYMLDRLRDEFQHAGLRVTSSGGYLIKPLPNDRMLELPSDLIEAYFQLGRTHFDFAAEIFVAGERD